jgi:hypothetical protein
MNIREVYSNTGTFLKAEDIGDKKPIVTISAVDLTERDYNDGQGIKKQLVLSFHGKEKKLGLNKTNADRLAELTKSDDTDDWIGVSIKLFVEKVQVGSEKKAAIRIFPELPEQAAEFSGNAEPPNFPNGTPDEVEIPW